jgi:hypothetical protein
VIDEGSNYLAFVDKHGGEIATLSAADPDALFYVSALTSRQKKSRKGPVSAEKRIWWVPERPTLFRLEQIAVFLEVGRVVGPGDPIVAFYPPAFEERLARLEKEFRAAMHLSGAPIRTVFNIGPDLMPLVASSE